MCHKLEMAAWDYRGDDLGPIERLILVRLCRFASADGGMAYPSMSFLCEETSVSLTTLKKTLRYLRDNNFIILISRAGEEKKTNVHQINFEKFGLSYNDLYACKKSTTTLSTVSVDKKMGGGATRPPQGRDTPPGGAPHAPNKHINTYLKTYGSETVTSGDNSVTFGKRENFDHISKKLSGESRMLFESLRNLKVDHKSIMNWILLHGEQRLMSLYRDVMQSHRENPSQIKNLGAYLRSMVESIPTQQVN